MGDSTSIPSDRSVVVLTDADGDSDDGGAASSSLADSVVVLLDTEAGSSNYPYDVRVLTDADKSIDAIACKVQDRLNQSQDFKSTRGYTADGDESLFFLDVVRRGLAPDRGLFVASEYQPFEKEEIERLIDLPYQERALRVMERFPLGMYFLYVFHSFVRRSDLVRRNL